MTRELHTLESELAPDEMRFLLSCLHERPLAGKHLEIGTAAGGTLKSLMLSYPVDRRPFFASVDTMTYYDDQYEVIRRNLIDGGLDPDAVEFQKMRSADALRLAKTKDERFSFIFIDASHKISHVTEDIGWAKLLLPGGLICFHDYSAMHPGVVSAVDRFRKRCPEYAPIGQKGSLIIFRKLRNAVFKEVDAFDRIRAHVLAFIWQTTGSLRKRAVTK
ncbi:MAG: class I SAM-dependent methyltransferase [Pseudonocardiaceae bacterium]|nr:MAG: class I SAM-dependent methyltransferase [Pseudonocardiaceae bacterium]